MPKKEDEKPESPITALMQKKFLEERKIFLWGQITDDNCKEVSEKLLYLEMDDPKKPISLYINTPGGSVTAGMAVYDTIKLVKSEVTVIVMGLAASMGSILLSAPKKGNRLLFPHSKVLIHQPLIGGQFTGPAVDIHILAEDLEKTREEMNKILADASGQPLEKIRKDTDRDFYLNAKEAIEYGLADRIVEEI